MKARLLATLLVFVFTGCAAISPYDGVSKISADQANDGSPTQISSAQAGLIAQAEVRRREHWPEEDWPKKTSVPYRLMHNISYEGCRLNKGRWRFVAHRGYQTTNPHDTHDFIYDPIPAAVIIIDNHAQVISYRHSSDPYLE